MPQPWRSPRNAEAAFGRLFCRARRWSVTRWIGVDDVRDPLDRPADAIDGVGEGIDGVRKAIDDVVDPIDGVAKGID